MAIDFANEFSEADINDLRLAKLRLENPGLASRIADLFGKPIDAGLKALPADWNRMASEIARKALLKALEVAIRTLGEETPGRSHDRLHRILVTGSGIAGGAAGLASLALELPLSTAIMLRSIADIARSEGHDVSSLPVKLSCLEVFALGGSSPGDDSVEEGYWVVRTALAKSVSDAVAYIGRRGVAEESAPPIVRLISAIASRFSVVITDEVAAKAVPVIGAAAGGAVNLVFMQHFQQMARGHFVVKRLERKFGTTVIERLYQEIPLDSESGSRRHQASRVGTIGQEDL
jgi:hypothetical protein